MAMVGRAIQRADLQHEVDLAGPLKHQRQRHDVTRHEARLEAGEHQMMNARFDRHGPACSNPEPCGWARDNE